jgi:hypothetical protein
MLGCDELRGTRHRPLVGCSSSTYKGAGRPESHQRSWWIVYPQPTRGPEHCRPESSSVSGIWDEQGVSLVGGVCRLSMNNPPTALVGFRTNRGVSLVGGVCRLSMNNPPTALVGFVASEPDIFSGFSFGLSMNDPTTLFGGYPILTKWVCSKR